jgi:surfeit locus 1 family protein
MIYFRPSIWFSVFMGFALLVLLWLGLWQLDRRAWKIELIEAAGSRSIGKALPIDEVIDGAEDLRSILFQKVVLSGSFDHSKEAYLFASRPEGIGYKVTTPFLREGHRPVLVDRGFVPESAVDPKSRREGQPKGPVKITGLIRLEGVGTFGVAAKQDGKPIWTYRDLAGMAQFMGLADPLPVFVEILPNGPTNTWPKPLEPDFSFPNNHLSYALTWFGLAFGLISVYIAFHISQRRLGLKKGD